MFSVFISLSISSNKSRQNLKNDSLFLSAPPPPGVSESRFASVDSIDCAGMRFVFVLTR